MEDDRCWGTGPLDMPGKHWTKREKRFVRQQVVAGVRPRDIVVDHRSGGGIRYLLRKLQIHWSNRWTSSQTRSLIAQVKQRRQLPEIHIEHKSKAAINAKRRYLRLAGKLRDTTGATKRQYTDAELAILEHYGWELGWSACQIRAGGVLPNRSYQSISKKLGRLAYGDPLRVRRAKQARRLTEDERAEFKKFLLTDGRHLSSEMIAHQFGVSTKVVNFHRRKQAVPLSWHEARAASSTDEKRERRAAVLRQHLEQRWAEYRERKIAMLLEYQQRLERSRSQAPMRTCRSCACQWFALPTFFAVQRRRLPHRVKISMAQTCRICQMKLRQERRQALAGASR